MDRDPPVAGAPGPAAFLRSQRGPLLLYAVFAGWCLFTFRPQIVAPDGAYYYAYLPAWVRGDFTLVEDLRRLGVEEVQLYRTATGGVANDWPAGPAVCWLPFYLLGLLLARGLPGAWLSPDQGALAMVYVGGSLCGWGALHLTYRALGRWFPARTALAATLLTGFGGLLAFHFSRPLLSPLPAAVTGTAFLAWWALHLQRPGRGRWAVLGALGGLATLVRLQSALFFLLPLGEAIWRWRAERDPRWLGKFALSAGTGALVFLPQLLIWSFLYGTPLALPKGNLMDWFSPRLWHHLFSEYHGLFFFFPLLMAAVAGLWWLRDRGAGIALGFVLTLGLQWYVNSCALSWWAGNVLAGRRLTSCFLIFAAGLAALLARGPRWVPWGLGLFPLWTLGLCLRGWRGEFDFYVPAGEILAGQGRLLRQGPRMLADHLRETGGWLAGAEGVVLLFSLILVPLLWYGIWRWRRSGDASRRTFPLRPAIGAAVGAWVLVLAATLRAGAATPRALEAPAVARAVAALSPVNRIEWATLHELGSYYLGKGRYAEAEATYGQLLTLRPEFVPAYNILGELAAHRGDWAAARRWFRRALAYDAANVFAREGLAKLPGAAPPAE